MSHLAICWDRNFDLRRVTHYSDTGPFEESKREAGKDVGPVLSPLAVRFAPASRVLMAPGDLRTRVRHQRGGTPGASIEQDANLGTGAHVVEPPPEARARPRANLFRKTNTSLLPLPLLNGRPNDRRDDSRCLGIKKMRQ